MNPHSIRPAAFALAAALWCPAAATGAQERPAAPVDWDRLAAYAHLADLTNATDSVLHASYPSHEIAVRDLGGVAGRVVLLTDHARKAHWIAARGTMNFENVLLDAESAAHGNARAGVRLHRGFEKYADAAYDSVRALLRPGYQVNLTGHSLGGAAAVILMMYLHADSISIGEVVTFGQPKVTDAHGVARYSAFPVTRVVDCRDPIPLTPPHGLLSALHGAFRHFGPEVILFDGPLHSVLPEHLAERADVTSFWRSLPHIQAHDHKMSNYRARIAAKLRGARAVSFRPGEPPACTPAS